MASTAELNALLNDAHLTPLPPAHSSPPEGASPQSPSNDAQSAKREMARKLVALNPALKGDGTTEEFLQTAEGLVKRQVPVAAKPAAIPAARNMDELIALSQRSYEQDKRKLESEISLLQAKLNGLKPRTLDQLMDRMAKLDPNLGSVVTQEAIATRRSYLDALGFTAAKFIARSKRAVTVYE